MRNRRVFQTQASAYIKLPTAVFSLNISPLAFVVLALLINCPDDFNPSLLFLGRSLRLGKSSVHRALQELLETNVIRRVIQGGQHKRSEYEFVEISEWKSKKIDEN